MSRKLCEDCGQLRAQGNASVQAKYLNDTVGTSHHDAAAIARTCDATRATGVNADTLHSSFSSTPSSKRISAKSVRTVKTDGSPDPRASPLATSTPRVCARKMGCDGGGEHPKN